MNLLKNPKPMTLSKINTNVWQMAKLSGTGSQKEKQKIFKDMFVSCDYSEPKWFVRLIQGNLRLGMADANIMSALAQC